MYQVNQPDAKPLKQETHTPPVSSDTVEIGSSSGKEAGSSRFKTINILHINDIHGTVEPFYDPDMSKDSLVGGIANTQTVLKNEKAKNPDGTLLLNAGDLADGSMVSDYSHGEVIAEALKPMGFDAIGLGNHDFCWGTGTLQNIMEKTEAQGVSANVVDSSNSNKTRPWKGIEPYIIRNVNGVKIGIIGLDTPSTAKQLSKETLGHIKFRDPQKTLGKYLPRMRKGGADVIVVLSHLGFEDDKELAKKFKDDRLLIVGGHSHIVLPNGHREGKSMIVQAGSQTRYVGNLTIQWDTEKKRIADMQASLLPVLADDIKPDPEIQTKVQPYIETLNRLGANEILGVVADDLDFDHHSAKILNQIQADSLFKDSGADIGISLASSIRRDVQKGEVTRRELYDTLPFKDWKAVKLSATGKAIKSLLEDGLDGGSRIMIPAGFKYRYNPLLPEGNRITDIIMPDGSPLDIQKNYTVVMDESLSKKPAMANVREKKEFGNIQDKFFNYFKEKCPPGGWTNSPDDRISTPS